VLLHNCPRSAFFFILLNFLFVYLYGGYLLLIVQFFIHFGVLVLDSAYGFLPIQVPSQSFVSQLVKEVLKFLSVESLNRLHSFQLVLRRYRMFTLLRGVFLVVYQISPKNCPLELSLVKGVWFLLASIFYGCTEHLLDVFLGEIFCRH